MSIPSPTPAANPYASPAIAPDVAPPEELPRELKIASQGKRFLNLILDNVVLFVVNQVVGFMVGVICGVYLGVTGQAVTPELQTQVNIASIFIGLAVALCYFVASEALLQRTLAKYLTGTMVVNEEGRRPTFGQIVGRSSPASSRSRRLRSLAESAACTTAGPAPASSICGGKTSAPKESMPQPANVARLWQAALPRPYSGFARSIVSGALPSIFRLILLLA